MVTVLAFDDEQDAVALANDTSYGLSGSIWTNELSWRCGCPGRWKPGTCR